MPRLILLTKRGEEHAIAVSEHDFRTAKVGPEGETYEELGYRLDRYEDTLEPYEKPRESRAARADEKKD